MHESMSYIAHSIMTHTQEVCQHVLPLMEQSVLATNTSTVQIGNYTVTLTISKQESPSILGKRRLSPIQEECSPRSWMPISKAPSEFYPKPSSDAILFNNLGHNFCHTTPHPSVSICEVSYIS